MNAFLAKSNGTCLAQHTQDVLQAVKELHCKQSKKFPDEWWEVLDYAALLHDLGKIDPLFQAKLNKRKLTDEATEIPHGLLSLFLFNPEELPFSDPLFAHTVVSAVAFHHWREYFPDLLMGYRANDFQKKAIELKSEQWINRCLKALQELWDTALSYGLNPELIKINTSLVDYLQYNDLGSAGLLVPPYTLAFLPAKIKGMRNQDDRERLRVFVAGTLMRADHFASLVEDDGQINLNEIESSIFLTFKDIKLKLSSLFNTSNYWQEVFFKNNTELQGETMLLVAPTGFGKTEFAYLWGAGKKNMLLLPMRAAVNKIYDRTVKLFSGDHVSLLHGDAALELYARSRDRNFEEMEGEQRKALELARHLAKSYIVATADQIAPAALRYPGYEKIFATLMNGALIIDEVQAYDPQAAAIVTHLIQQNSFFGGKTLLMTATLPPFIREAIKRRVDINEKQVIKLLELPDFEKVAESSRHRIRFISHKGNYDEVVEEIVDSAVNGKKVLVIMNTVKAACAIYDTIRSKLQEDECNIKTALLHSRFTFDQRQKLEELIVDNYMPNTKERDESPCIVVSTQVVEASLDIDADIMFTEPAPVDSLIQRMGRVYRRFARSWGNNAPEDANVVIMINTGKNEQKKKKADKEDDLDVVLASGMGKVYDRNLVVLSLVVLLSAFKNRALLETVDDVGINLDDKPWNSCFKKKSGSDKKINKSLSNVIYSIAKNTLLITEKQKMNWVERTYRLLEAGSTKLNLGNYLVRYYETLEMLDHGYCSDKRRDAMRLFRNVTDVPGIPERFLEEFYQKINNWIRNKSGNIRYIEMAVNILPSYIVNCPYRILEKIENSYGFLEIDKMIPHGLNGMSRQRVYDKLERWLSDVRVINLPYDDEKGLAYFEF